MSKRIQRSNQRTLEQSFREFIAEKEAVNLSKATINNYVQSFNMLLLVNDDLEYSVPSSAVKPYHIHQLVCAMKGMNIKPASINHYLRDCRAFLYWCMERGYIEQFKVKLVESQEESLKLFTDAELKMLLNKPDKNDSYVTWRTWTIVNWVLGTGNRESTICEVRIGDVDFTAREISLRHTKNKRLQIVPLSQTLEVALREFIRVWRASASDDDYLFCNVCEEQMTTSALRQSFYDYCKQREVSKTSLHGLRHNFAKGWVRNNGNMFVLQKILGHSTLDMTRKYVRLFSEDIKENYEQYSPLDTITKSSSRLFKIKRSK